MSSPQTNQEEDQVNKIKTNLRSLLQIAKLKSIEDIYSDSYLFYLFHSVCVKNVIFRTKWKKGICREPYYKYTDESDEAFAFLVLVNNANRIEDMANPDKGIDEWRQPLYTEATKSSTTYKTGRTSPNPNLLKGKGWTTDAILMFATLQESVCKYRISRKESIEKLGRDVLEFYRINHGTKGGDHGTTDDDYEEDNKRRREEKEKQLDIFFRSSAKRRHIGDTMIHASTTSKSMPDLPQAGNIINGSTTSESMPDLPQSGNLIYGSTTSKSMRDLLQSGNIYSEHELSLVEQGSLASSFQS